MKSGISPTCAESHPDNRQINALARKLALHFLASWDQTLFESWQVLLGKAHSLWQNDAETAALQPHRHRQLLAAIIEQLRALGSADQTLRQSPCLQIGRASC